MIFCKKKKEHIYIMKPSYQKTIYACFIGYIVQAIVNNFVPLLFLTFEKTYRIPLSRITMLITINFGIQLLVDLLSAGFVDKIGYRISVVLAHIFAAVGLAGLVFLPDLLPDPFAGLLLAVCIYALGGGLIEVLISPIVESCPTDNKEKAMSLLHSFYCWGHVGVVLLSTIFFSVFGIVNWKILACIWALVPVLNACLFVRTPIAPLIEEGETGMSMGELFCSKVFWLMMLMMLCAGASEQAVSQWASTFAEKGLGVTKTIGDLAGPMLFAILMGSSRAFYGKAGHRMDLDRFMLCSSVLCILSYLLIVFFTASGIFSCGMRHLRLICRNYVAGHVQQGIVRPAQRRHCHVCTAGAGRRSGMFRRANAGRGGCQCGFRQSEDWNSCGNYLSGCHGTGGLPV